FPQELAMHRERPHRLALVTAHDRSIAYDIAEHDGGPLREVASRSSRNDLCSRLVDHQSRKTLCRWPADHSLEHDHADEGGFGMRVTGCNRPDRIRRAHL